MVSYIFGNTRIYFVSTSMNESFRVYNDSIILNRVLEFPVTLVWTETPIFTYGLNVH